jgi:hypothetical protein
LCIKYSILAQGLADPIVDEFHLSTTFIGAAPIIALDLPLRILVVLAMAAGAAIKSIYWVSYISKEEMLVSNAVKVSVFEIIFSR